MKPYTIHLHSSIILDAPVERLWPLLSDTDRTNRMIGLPAFERTRPDRDLVQIVYGHFLGVPVSWREHPFEWIFEQQFSVEREFAPPLPVERLQTVTRFTSLPEERTKVDVEVHIAPRNLVGAIGGRLIIGQRMLRQLRHVYRQTGELVAASDQVVLPPVRKPRVNLHRLRVAAERLRSSGIHDALIERLVSHLINADDPQVLKMRAFALADAWGEPRMDVLRMCLYATRAGLLDLEWDVLCPSCRGASQRVRSLSDLEHDAYCPSCDVRYDTNFDESIEVRFSVNPDIRDAVDVPYCIGGPANTPHIVAQIALPAHGRREVRLRLAPNRYRLRSRQMTARAVFDVSDHAESSTAHIVFDNGEALIDPPVIRSGYATVTIENATATSALIVIEQRDWSEQATSAALVTSLTEFRQMFSSEALSPGVGIAIRSLTFLFSDLKGSTAMYEQIGDTPAYARVRDHFAVMSAIIGAHNGALVKTIGDAVMAVFASTRSAVAAALEIQREFTLGEIARGNPALRIKLGMHTGPCIAVNANNLLDYFGSTVNIAARVQNESVGGDIVLTDALIDDPAVRPLLEQEGAILEPFERELRGLSQRFRLTRVWVTPPATLAKESLTELPDMATIPGTAGRGAAW
jgi:adenylate cyclase